MKKRPDRAKKFADKKLLSETVVKCCLKKLILSNKPLVVKAIQDRVEACSKRTYIASVAINLVLKEAFHNVEDSDIASALVPNVIDQTFIRQAMLGAEDAVKPCQEIKHVYESNPPLKAELDAILRYDADRNIYSAGSKKYLINMKNHLVLNLERTTKKIIYSTAYRNQIKDAGLPIKETIKALLYDILGWNGKCNKDLLEQLPPSLQMSYRIQKAILGDEAITKQWLKTESNLYRVIKYFVYANRYLEANGEKVFNLVPICKMGSHFITIDTYSLYGIALDAGFLDSEKTSGTAFVEMGLEHWGSILNTHAVSGKGETFTRTIDTDGVAVCVHFTRPKSIPKTEEERKAWMEKLKADLNIEIIGIDPGRSNIFYAVRMVEGVPKTFRLTRSHYYKSSGIVKAAQNSEEWLRPIQEQITLLSENSPKGVSLVKFQQYINVVLGSWKKIWKETLHPKWANQRLRLYGGKKRVFSQFFNKLETPGKTTVIAYGASKFAPGGKNEISVPTTRAYKESSYRFPTFPVNEFRSTIVYNGDKKTVLQKVMRKDTGREVRGLLWYNSTNQMNCKLINRDLNGALNIRDCFVLPKRPPMLCRKEGAPKLVKVVGKVINC
jgi:hypothetical protein